MCLIFWSMQYHHHLPSSSSSWPWPSPLRDLVVEQIHAWSPGRQIPKLSPQKAQQIKQWPAAIFSCVGSAFRSICPAIAWLNFGGLTARFHVFNLKHKHSRQRGARKWYNPEHARVLIDRDNSGFKLHALVMCFSKIQEIKSTPYRLYYTCI